MKKLCLLVALCAATLLASAAPTPTPDAAQQLSTTQRHTDLRDLGTLVSPMICGYCHWGCVGGKCATPAPAVPAVERTQLAAAEPDKPKPNTGCKIDPKTCDHWRT